VGGTTERAEVERGRWSMELRTLAALEAVTLAHDTSITLALLVELTPRGGRGGGRGGPTLGGGEGGRAGGGGEDRGPGRVNPGRRFTTTSG